VIGGTEMSLKAQLNTLYLVKEGSNDREEIDRIIDSFRFLAH
jgi:hypothetical protein